MINPNLLHQSSTEFKEGIIDHVPTSAELEASKPSADAINVHNPAQLAAFNAVKASFGLPPTSVPSASAIRKTESTPAFQPSGEVPYIAPEVERRRSPEEMRQIRRELGIVADR